MIRRCRQQSKMAGSDYYMQLVAQQSELAYTSSTSPIANYQRINQYEVSSQAAALTPESSGLARAVFNALFFSCYSILTDLSRFRRSLLLIQCQTTTMQTIYLYSRTAWFPSPHTQRGCLLYDQVGQDVRNQIGACPSSSNRTARRCEVMPATDHADEIRDCTSRANKKPGI